MNDKEYKVRWSCTRVSLSSYRGLVTYSASAVDKEEEVHRRKGQPEYDQMSCFSPGAPHRSFRYEWPSSVRPNPSECP